MIRPIQSSPIRGRCLADRRSSGSTKCLIEREIEPWPTIRAKASQAPAATSVLPQSLSQSGQNSPRLLRRLLSMARGASAQLTRDKFFQAPAKLPGREEEIEALRQKYKLPRAGMI